MLYWTWFLARSLAACELLYNAGYSNLFWVQGGFEAAEEEACFPISIFWNFYCALLCLNFENKE
jgi:hypothetical protein